MLGIEPSSATRRRMHAARNVGVELLVFALFDDFHCGPEGVDAVNRVVNHVHRSGKLEGAGAPTDTFRARILTIPGIATNLN